MHRISDGRVEVEEWDRGERVGWREANDAEAWCALVAMVSDLQDEVLDLKSRLSNQS